MSICDVNFNQIGQQLLPPDKRGKKTVAWITALLSPLQWLRDLWFGDYRSGSSGLLWVNSTPYAKGDRTIYKGSAYESLTSANLGNLPTDINNWMLVQKNFIGIEERLKYNSDLLLFTFAINKYFNTVFRQPNNVSDIYVTVQQKPVTVFTIGFTETSSSKVYSNLSSEFVINSYHFADYFNMIIHVPVAVFNALDTDPLNCDKIIRNFADRYIIAGIIYLIQTY